MCKGNWKYSVHFHPNTSCTLRTLESSPRPTCKFRFDLFGHHRAARSRTGALGRREFPLESAIARICREAGGRVVTNMLVRDMDLGVPAARLWTGSRCTEVCNLHWTQRWCQVSEETGSQEEEPQTLTGWHCSRRGSAKRVRTPNSWAKGQSTFGRRGAGGWEQVVRRSKVFRGTVGESPCQDGAASDPAKDGTNVEAQMVFHLGVHGSAFFCHVSVGHEGCSWG